MKPSKQNLMEQELKKVIWEVQQTNRKVSLLEAKLMEVDEKNQRIWGSTSIKNLLRADKKTTIEEIKGFEKMIDIQTLDNNFCFSGNKITLMRSAFPSEQVLLNIKVPEQKLFSFQTHIISGNLIKVGIIDKTKFGEGKQSFNSGNTICYSGSGLIFWGEKNGSYQFRETKDKLVAGSELVVEVNKLKGIVCFILRDRKGCRFYEVSTDILLQQDREFVPYFQMEERGDSIIWEIIDERLQFISEKPVQKDLERFREKIDTDFNAIAQKLNDDLIQGQKNMEQSILEIREKLNDGLNKTKGEIIGKLQKMTEDIATNKGEMQNIDQRVMNNSEIINKQMRDVLKNFQQLKNEFFSKIKALESRFQTSIKEIERRSQEQVKKIKNQLKEDSQQRSRISANLNKIFEKMNLSLIEETPILTKEKEEQTLGELMRLTPTVVFDQTTSCVNNFRISEKMITLTQSTGLPQQLLVNEVVRSFTIRIKKSKYNNIIVGVVSKTQQRGDRSFSTSGNAVCYSGIQGIFYGKDGKAVLQMTGDELREGTEVKMWVEGETMSFQLTDEKKVRVHTCTSSLLSRPYQYFIEMQHAGDCLQWAIQ